MYTLFLTEVRNFTRFKFNCKYQAVVGLLHTNPQYLNPSIFSLLSARNKDVQSENWIRLQNEDAYGFAQ